MNNTARVPNSHRRHLQQIISGLSEGVILIDLDRTIAWANGTALAMHGVKELEDLGGTSVSYRKKYQLKYRNNHRLLATQYPMERTLNGDEFTDMVVELASVDDDEFRRVLQISGLVLRDDAGTAESAVLVMQDVTERYNAEERFEKAFNANPAPAVICRLSDLRYVKVNQGFQDMTGYTRDKVIGSSVYEIDVLEGVQDKDAAIERLNEGKTIPQTEAMLRLPDGSKKAVIVAGQTIEVEDEACMLFTFNDLDPRKKVEDELRQMEERFSKAFRLAPVPMTVSTLENFSLLEVNDAFLTATGYTVEEVMASDTAYLAVWANPQEYRQLQALLEKTNSVRNYEIQLLTKEGALIDCLASAETVTINGKRCVLGVMQDITQRKQSEVELIAAIETVMQDTSWFSRTVIEKLAQIRRPQGQAGSRSELADLTPREREVLGLICQGLDNDEIGGALQLSRNTVRNHIATIYSKIDVHRRSAAIVWARDRGIIGYEKPVDRKKHQAKVKKH